jgi:hypothetical protein
MEKNKIKFSEVEVPENREEAFFDTDEEDNLFDAYLMLRFVGLSDNSLSEIEEAIEKTTVYSKEDLHEYYKNEVEE